MKAFAYTRKIYENPRALSVLRAVDFTAVAVCAISLIAVIIQSITDGDYVGALTLSLTVGVPFVILSFMRRVINAKRPYEVYDFGVCIDGKSGSSFPSRHAFSAFAIAVALMPSYLVLGICAVIMGLLLCTVRVLLGLHFVRDVAVGAFVGVLGSLIGIFIF